MRLIDADNLKIPNDAPYKASVKRVVAQQPTVEAVPVVHGKWKMRGGRLYCTNCEKKALEEKDRDDWYGCIGSNFCPNCGSDMRTSAE